jgi:hypothetical protein
MVQASAEFSFSFDFDEWATLARVDPYAFEERRLALIENFLGQFPATEQRRLRGLQFRIDMERQRARTPMAACLRISSMMWDSLLGSHGLKSALLGNPAPGDKSTRARPAGSRSATILPFRKPQP